MALNLALLPMNAPAKDLVSIEFKGTALSVISVVLRSLDMAELERTIAAMPGGKRQFFDGDAAVLDMSAVAEEKASWPALLKLLREYGVQPVAVCNAGEALAAAAAKAGLVSISAADLSRARKPAGESKPAPEPVAPVAASAPSPAVASAAPLAAPTMIVDKPLRSGQRVYARGGDLVLTAMVSAGAEVIADGSIHIYAPLRGKALAGATGNAAARVFCTCFEAELVSVAGMYRTFEDGVPEKLRGQPVSVWLEDGSEEGQHLLRMEALSLR